MSEISDKKTQMVFKYKKAEKYKNYHIDGIFGGVLPTTNIWCEIFLEKREMPEKVICDLDVNTGSLKEVEQLPKVENNEILREVQAGFTMNLNTAKTLRNWLDDKINMIESQIKK